MILKSALFVVIILYLVLNYILDGLIFDFWCICLLTYNDFCAISTKIKSCFLNPKKLPFIFLIDERA